MQIEKYFQYDYSLSLQTRHTKNNKGFIVKQGDFLEFSNLSIDLNISKHAQNTTLQSTLKVIGLSSQKADILTSTRYEQNDLRKCVLELGFKNAPKNIVYNGNIILSSFRRQGNDTILELLMRNGSIAIEQINKFYNFQAGTSIKDIVNLLIRDMLVAGIQRKRIVNLDTLGVISYNFTFEGNPLQALRKLLNNIPNSDVYAILQDVNLHIVRLSDDSPPQAILGGKFNTITKAPRQLDNFHIECSTTLNPFIDLMDIVQLQSQINPRFNGTYIVIGVQHKGLLSETTTSNLATNFTLLQPEYGDNWFATYT